MHFLSFNHMNVVAIFAVICYMLALFIHDFIRQPPSALLYRDPFKSTACAFWFYFVTMVCVLFGYLFSWIESALDPERYGCGLPPMPHAIIHISQSFFSNVASVALLTSGLAYSLGANFKLGRAIAWVSLFALATLAWSGFFELVIGHSGSLFWTMVEKSPEIIVANIALIFFGWSIYSRWGGAAFSFLILTVAYAVLQLPANLSDAMICLFGAHDLESSFPSLAIGKIAISYGFISLLCSSTVMTGDEIRAQILWPERTVTPNHWMLPRIGGWFGWVGIHALILAFVAALIIDWLRRVLWP